MATVATLTPSRIRNKILGKDSKAKTFQLIMLLVTGMLVLELFKDLQGVPKKKYSSDCVP